MGDSKQTEKCSAQVTPSDWGQTYQCTRNWKVQRHGKKFCTIHDPVRIEEKIQQREAKWRKERKEDNAIMNRRDLEEKFCKGVKNNILRANKLINLIRTSTF